MMAEQHVYILAHHALLLAIPAFAPAIAVVGVVIWVAMRDRRIPDDASTVEDDASTLGDDANTLEDDASTLERVERNDNSE
jgi:hypothetical protein